MAWVGVALMAFIAVAMGVCVIMISRGTLHRNEFMGIRVPATMISEDAWQAAHRSALPWWAAAVVLSAAGAIGFLVAALARVPDSVTVAWYIGSLVLILIVIVIPVPAAIRAARATQTWSVGRTGG